MANFSKEKVKNIAIIGHGGEGKTSLLEAILYQTNGIDRLGKINDGTTVSDYDTEEINRKMSISSALSYAIYNDYKLNFIDVPGFFDFEGEFVGAMSVADSAIIVTQASCALSVGTEKAIDYCVEAKIPMILFINGVNKENSDYIKTVNAIREKYGTMIAPVDYPIMNGSAMIGFVDVIQNKAYDNSGNLIDIPASLVEISKADNNELAETAAGATEELMEKFFEEGELSRDDKVAALKSMFLDASFVPTIPGVAVGSPVLADLLDIVLLLCPSAGENGGKVALVDGEEKEICYDESAPFSCQVFKTVVDPFVGKLLLFKGVTGSVKIGDVIFNMRKEEQEKVSALYVLKGKSQEPTDIIKAGDIGAFAKMSVTRTSDTLCDPNAKLEYKTIPFPKPVLSLALVNDEKGNTDKVVDGLRKLMDEDRTFIVEKDKETLETVIRGMGETQIDILCKRVKNKYKVETQLAEPKVAYRETIKATVEQQGKCKKQNGGSGLFGDVHIRFEPAPEVEEFEFCEEIVGGAVPKQYFPSVEKGLKEARMNGVLAGCPMVNFKATLYFGSYHPVDSKEAAFIEAAKIAFKEGIPKAKPVLLEPVANVSVVVPTYYMGDIMGDITKRRGKVFGMDTEKDKTIINGEVPMSEMHRYATDLRSMTQGRGRFSLSFARYDEVPAMAVAKIVEEEKKKRNK